MRDMLDRPTQWPTEIEGCTDDCHETCYLMEDQGQGYCSYECPVHGAFAVQYDDDDDDWDDEFGFLDPYFDDETEADDELDWVEDDA